jgi:hypothetical protein
MSVFIPTSPGRKLIASYSGSATQDFTIFFWAKLNGTTPAANRSFFSIEPNLTITTDVNGLTSAIKTSLSTYTGRSLPINEWFNIAVIVSSSSTTNHFFRTYINCVENFIATDTSTFSAITGLTVGNSTQQGADKLNLNGNIQNLIVFDRVLNISEIISLSNFRRPEVPGIILNSPFDDDIFTDISGNGILWSTSGGSGIILDHGIIKPFTSTKTNTWR